MTGGGIEEEDVGRITKAGDLDLGRAILGGVKDPVHGSLACGAFAVVDCPGQWCQQLRIGDPDRRQARGVDPHLRG